MRTGIKKGVTALATSALLLSGCSNKSDTKPTAPEKIVQNYKSNVDKTLKEELCAKEAMDKDLNYENSDFLRSLADYDKCMEEK